jgi:N-acetylmuramoyl-L-alanine amidase
VSFRPAVRVAAGVALLGVFAAAANATAARTYLVQPGDSLSAIAVEHGTSVSTLARLNGLSPGGVLLAGSTLRLPGPTTDFESYRARSGDTLTGLAQSVGWSVAALARANGVSVTHQLLIGERLRVPVRTTPAAPEAAGTSTSTQSYTVHAGDSLSSIAVRYGVSLGELADLNHMAMNDVLLVGRTLALPANTLASFSRSSVRGSIAYWANHYGVDVHLATALAWMESGFNNDMVSPVGAVGVMQITPDTWDYVEQVLLLGLSVPHNADGNVRIGVAYLHHLLHVYGGDERSALAAYYQGARALDSAGFLPGTKLYVDDILALKARF